MRWTYDPSALYTILCIDEGKSNETRWQWLWRSEEEKATKVQFLHLDHDQSQGGDICDLTGIPALQPPNLQFIHWMVSNVPGDRVCTFGENHIFLFFFSNLSQLKWCQGLCWRRELWVRPSFQLQAWLQQPACKLLPRWCFYIEDKLFSGWRWFSPPRHTLPCVQTIWKVGLEKNIH